MLDCLPHKVVKQLTYHFICSFCKSKSTSEVVFVWQSMLLIFFKISEKCISDLQLTIVKCKSLKHKKSKHCLSQYFVMVNLYFQLDGLRDTQISKAHFWVQWVMRAWPWGLCLIPSPFSFTLFLFCFPTTRQTAFFHHSFLSLCFCLEADME